MNRITDQMSLVGHSSLSREDSSLVSVVLVDPTMTLSDSLGLPHVRTRLFVDILTPRPFYIVPYTYTHTRPLISLSPYSVSLLRPQGWGCEEPVYETQINIRRLIRDTDLL